MTTHCVLPYGEKKELAVRCAGKILSSAPGFIASLFYDVRQQSSSQEPRQLCAICISSGQASLKSKAYVTELVMHYIYGDWPQGH